ncbi:Major Facilitator Superfamily protein [Pseudovibrio axinellae]|uniref:Major Facilitator Superfamily protein n=1 Tax=Pseudovibrio axinellae TaxID=989403 RepID=A0A161VB91_9HYPH|nr:MFS transporter [Pseudovibrio axinellae]KZL21374.1 Major Facilitator Superfamily protein [Pseudovibrio axinellae]SEQ97899.1 Major Facilitator Superfamily protein [Pseudovibrio axinellae]
MFTIIQDIRANWRSPFVFLLVVTIASQLSFSVWWNLVNNFAVNTLGFTGQEIGIQQSIREIPGLLAFTVIFMLLIFKEQTFALISLALMGFGIAITGYFPSAIGFYATTLIMSFGFHYYETLKQSLSLQWLPKEQAPQLLGKILAVSSLASLCVYGLILVSWKAFNLTYEDVFLWAGLAGMALTLFAALAFPKYKAAVEQHKKLILRKRYWLYYALTFMSGARRQIFTVFAGFLMVERFDYEVHHVAGLFLLNGAINMILAPKIGAFIGKVGERTALTCEYIGLIIVFMAYAFVTNVYVAGALYVIDHAFFAMAISMKTYFQKVAEPADIAPTSAVDFTINHIAAVVIPVVFGTIWLFSPTLVFIAGAAMASISLILSRMIPRHPEPGNETVWVAASKQQPLAAE